MLYTERRGERILLRSGQSICIYSAAERNGGRVFCSHTSYIILTLFLELQFSCELKGDTYVNISRFNIKHIDTGGKLFERASLLMALHRAHLTSARLSRRDIGGISKSGDFKLIRRVFMAPLHCMWPLWVPTRLTLIRPPSVALTVPLNFQLSECPINQSVQLSRPREGGGGTSER